MNILHTVEFYSPSVGGAQEVIKQISERLVHHGHSVTVATTKLSERKNNCINGVYIEEFDISGNAVYGLKGKVEAYQEFLLDSKFDLMMNYAAQQWATDLVFPVLPLIPYAKIFTPCGFSALYDPRFQSYFSEMPDVFRQYNHLIFHSNDYRDINFARQYGLSQFTVIPNGASQAEFDQVDLSFRERYKIEDDTFLMVTIGTHTGLKGHRLAIETLQRAKIKQAALVIIGNLIGMDGCLEDCRKRAKWLNLTSFGNKKVLLLDMPRNDVVAALQAADLFVFFSNIEYSPIVLFEAMASKTPFVTLACGNAKEIVAWSQGGILLPTSLRTNGLVDADPEVVANAIQDLANNPLERQRLAETGFRAWKERFTWEKITIEYEKLYIKVAERNKYLPLE